MHIALCRLRCCNLSIVSIYHNFTNSYGRKLGHSTVDSYLVCGQIKWEKMLRFSEIVRLRSLWRVSAALHAGVRCRLGWEGGGLNFYNNEYSNKNFVV